MSATWEARDLPPAAPSSPPSPFESSSGCAGQHDDSAAYLTYHALALLRLTRTNVGCLPEGSSFHPQTSSYCFYPKSHPVRHCPAPKLCNNVVTSGGYVRLRHSHGHQTLSMAFKSGNIPSHLAARRFCSSPVLLTCPHGVSPLRQLLMQDSR